MRQTPRNVRIKTATDKNKIFVCVKEKMTVVAQNFPMSLSPRLKL